MAEGKVFSANFFRYSDKRQLIDEDEWLEDDDNDDKESEGAEISARHLHFVTNASMSSWKDQDAAAFHSNTSFG